MTKKSENAVRAKFLDHQYNDALKVLTSLQLSDALALLSAIQEALEQSISDYVLDVSCDLLDDETSQIVRTFWFGKGMLDYHLCIDGTGLIRAIDYKMPDFLFDQIMNTLDPFYE